MSKFDPILILAGILGLDTSNAKDTQMIGYHCENIEDVWAFIEYCKDKQAGIEFMKSTQKLSILAEQYKKLEDEAKMHTMYSKMGGEVKTLCSKVYHSKSFIKDGGKWTGAVIKDTGECFFTDKELKLLKAVGSPLYVVELLETYKLNDELFKVWKKSLEQKKSYELLDTKIKNLLQGAKE